MDMMTRVQLKVALTRFVQEHPSDGWGGHATSVADLRNAVKLEVCDHSDVESELRRLHTEGVIYVQRWNWDLSRFLPWHTADVRFFDGTFRILAEQP